MNVGLLLVLVASALMILSSQNMLSVIVLSGIYSVSICTLFVVLDAVDVAFTEAAVGAGISTVLMILAIRGSDHRDNSWSWPSLGSIAMGLSMGVLLILGTLDMPFYGQPDAPVHLHLAPRFLGESGNEIGIPNVVTSVLASYRGYDTLGEVVVIFTAGIAVVLLLTAPGEAGGGEEKAPLSESPILNSALFRIVPWVLLFGLYVQFHGDYGPGGGFQAGVIFGAGFITVGLLAGRKKMLLLLEKRWIAWGAAAGVLVYAGVGVAAILLGGTFLNYSVLAGEQTTGQHIGILVIELGVGITVAFTMISLFVSFTGRLNGPKRKL